MSRRLRQMAGETPYQRAHRLADAAWASVAARLPKRSSMLAFATEAKEFYAAGYLAALDDIVEPRRRRGGK